jgi:hypothetical protein
VPPQFFHSSSMPIRYTASHSLSLLLRRRACKASSSSNTASSVPKYHLSAADLAAAYGKGESLVLDQRAVEQACAAIMACQVRQQHQLLAVVLAGSSVIAHFACCVLQQLHLASSCNCTA